MAKADRYFSVEELEEEYDLPYNALHTEVGDKHRWYTFHELVFQADDGKYYEVSYMDPATEMQDGQERWYDDPMPAYEVEEQEVVVKKWVPVNG